MRTANPSALPHGWVETTLAEVVEPRIVKSDPQGSPEARYIGMDQVEAHRMRLLGTREAGSMKSTANMFRGGDVLYGRLRPYLNKVYQPDFDGMCSSEFIVMPETSAVRGNFLKYRMNSGDFVAFSSGLNTGDRPRVDFSQIGEFKLSLPPRGEQSRIADALDELFSDLDAGVSALERTREKLALYRASVLNAAVDGTLTADWRTRHPQVEPASELLERILAERRLRWEQDQLRQFEEKGRVPPRKWRAKYREPESFSTAPFLPLPKGWCWATLDQIGSLDRGRSRHRPRNAEFLYGGPFPFIQTGDVRRAQQYIREHSQTYSQAGLKQSRLWPAETLCVTIAANIANSAILSYPACFPDSIVGIQFDESTVSVRYAEMYIRTVRAQIEEYAPATAQKNINNTVLRTLPVPLPPVDEQFAIVEAADIQLSTIDHIESVLVDNLKTARELRQSILHHAFGGRLVPQDPNDESASELLKRIATERESRARKVRTVHRTRPRPRLRRR